MVVLLFLLSIRFAFWRTYEAWKINRQLTAQLSNAASVSYQPGYLERKNHNLDQTLTLFKGDTAHYRSAVLTALSSVAERENVKITGVPDGNDASVTPSSSSQVQSIILEGDFFALTRFLHGAEQATGIGRVRSAQYRTTTIAKATGAGKRLTLLVHFELMK